MKHPADIFITIDLFPFLENGFVTDVFYKISKQFLYN